ncbi:MAG: hypothetical protein ACLQJ0_15890 [Steroidobacteraceae bacterium]
MATPAGFEPATFSLEVNWPPRQFNAVLTNRRISAPLNPNNNSALSRTAIVRTEATPAHNGRRSATKRLPPWPPIIDRFKGHRTSASEHFDITTQVRTVEVEVPGEHYGACREALAKRHFKVK